MAAKTNYWYCAIILIYAINKQENGGVDFNFFASKEAYPVVRKLEKNNGRKSASESSELREKTNFGSIWTPPLKLVTWVLKYAK